MNNQIKLTFCAPATIGATTEIEMNVNLVFENPRSELRPVHLGVTIGLHIGFLSLQFSVIHFSTLQTVGKHLELMSLKYFYELLCVERIGEVDKCISEVLLDPRGTSGGEVEVVELGAELHELHPQSLLGILARNMANHDGSLL